MYGSSTFFTTLAGTPAEIESLEMSLMTTALAPIIELSPIVTGPKTLAPALINTLSPIIGLLLPFFVLYIFPPMVTHCIIVAFFPIIDS
jgi:hypothetical protein